MRNERPFRFLTCGHSKLKLSLRIAAITRCDCDASKTQRGTLLRARNVKDKYRDLSSLFLAQKDIKGLPHLCCRRRCCALKRANRCRQLGRGRYFGCLRAIERYTLCLRHRAIHRPEPVKEFFRDLDLAHVPSGRMTCLTVTSTEGAAAQLMVVYRTPRGSARHPNQPVLISSLRVRQLQS